MNSALYKCLVMHNRLAPKQNRFHYHIFMWALDLDELQQLDQNLFLMSLNKRNVFSFWEKDYMKLGAKHPNDNKTLKEKLRFYLSENGIELGDGKVMLYTHLRTFGYIFNPVSFYYCYSANGAPLCAIVEVTNTFLETKRFILSSENLKSGKYYLNTTKYFYVSPFVALDTNFDFHLNLPGEKFNVRIDDIDKAGNRFFISTLSGVKKGLSNIRLLGYIFRFPLITLQIIFLIHWQALILWLKKVPFHKKGANIHLQREALKPY